MISGVNSLSSGSISLLFGLSNAVQTAPAGSVNEKQSAQSTVKPANLLDGASAIGKIIEIVAGMKASKAQPSVGMFTMDGAKRVDGMDGEYSLTKTGTGTVVSEGEQQANGVSILQQQAAGSGPDADQAKAYLKALSDGSMQITDLSTKGVSATMTQTNFYYADGRDRGEKTSYSVTGLNEFLKANTFTGDDGTLRDKETGKYASIGQNGTKFTYEVY